MLSQSPEWSERTREALIDLEGGGVVELVLGW